MNEEDEAFEDLAKRQGDWGMQGSRKHQIMRYAENVESKGTSMTQDEIIALARQAGVWTEEDDWFKDAEFEDNWNPKLEAFAKLVAEAEREANAKMVDHILKEGGGTWGDAIRARRRTHD